jgi:serine/threonine-protein kinase HipA
MSAAEALGVWLDGVRVAELAPGRGGRISCRYDEQALERWPANSPVISCSLPLGSRPQDALAFCRGLLPEGEALRAMAEQAGLATHQTFELLARFGRDVAGALVIAEGEPEERRFGVESLDRTRLATAVEELDAHPLGAHDDSELSLAGLQDKLLLVKLEDGSWGRPLHGRPSTHILKADDPHRPGLVEAEAHCLALARTVGLTTIDTQLERIGERACLIVSRFDRTVGPDGVRRIHQEDLCQALAIDPDDRKLRAKYERAGGPRFRQAAQLLDSYARDPVAQLDRLVAVVTFTVLIGNADAHGKNLALLHPDPERVELAPLYDTVPTVLWSKLRSEAAMSIGAQVALPDVTLADIVREARLWRHPPDRAEAVALATIRATSAAVADGAVPPSSPVAELVRKRAAELLGAAGTVSKPFSHACR